MLKKVLSFVLSVLSGGVFAYSAYTKLFPIEPFEYTLVDIGFIPWSTTPFIARILIGFECICALFLLANWRLQKYTIPMVVSTLVLFSIYLIGMLIAYGDTGNCGCFGQAISMTPSQGIIKNLLLLLPLFYIYKNPITYHVKYESWAVGILAVCCLAMPFIVNPVLMTIPQQYATERINYPLALDILYNDPENTPPQIELRKGKHVIAFMSLTCPHCKVAAQKLRVMKDKNKALSIHLILNGEKADLQPFWEATRADNLSWSLFVGAKNFLKLTPPNLPQIYMVNASIVERKCNYLTLTQEEIEDWLAN